MLDLLICTASSFQRHCGKSVSPICDAVCLCYTCPLYDSNHSVVHIRLFILRIVNPGKITQESEI